MIQSIGRRIADLRSQSGWTQQYLAERLAISRVAVSHIEMDLTIPGERTVTLLAGLFKITPYDLVANTTYPQAKTDRLPLIACSFTPLEYDLGLLTNDMAWLDALQGNIKEVSLKVQVAKKWSERLSEWDSTTLDPHEKKLIWDARQQIQQIISSKQ